MSMIIKTTIRNLNNNYLTAESWVDDGGLEGDWLELAECEDMSSLVTILGEETDGYMNIRLPSGLEVVGISVHHLDGFNDDATNTINWRELKG